MQKAGKPVIMTIQSRNSRKYTVKIVRFAQSKFVCSVHNHQSRKQEADETAQIGV